MEWISVKDRLPKYKEDVLLSFERIFSVLKQDIKIGYRYKTDDTGESYKIFEEHSYSVRTDVTHWMPLPKNPQR